MSEPVNIKRHEWEPEQVAPNESVRAAHEVQQQRIDQWRAVKDRCEHCGLVLLYDPKLHKCDQQHENGLANPYRGMSWTEECRAKQDGDESTACKR